jgi:hypothetical protein
LTEGEVIIESATGGRKGQKNERFDLIPPGPLRAIARAFGYGSSKYSPRNWEKGYDWSLSFGALQRHLWAFWSGEDTDPESGLPHLAHAAFHSLALMEFMDVHKEFDDRPSKTKEKV